MSPDTAIDRILDLSAEAQARRRTTTGNSPEFHRLTGAVLAYGQALTILTRLRLDFYRQQRSVKTLAFAYLSAKDLADRYQGR